MSFLLITLALAQTGGTIGDHLPFDRPNGATYSSLFANVGDRDSDGFDEIAFADDAGNLHLVSSRTRLTAQSISLQAKFGESDFLRTMKRMGDQNGDGVEELLVLFASDSREVKIRYTIQHSYRGSLYYVDGASFSPLWHIEGADIDDRLGHALERTPDLDGDGLDDIVVGIPHFPRGQDLGIGSKGRVALLSSSDGSLIRGVTRAGEGAAFGESASVPGDLNGDGYPDLVTGAPAEKYPNGGEGKAYAIDLKTGSTLWERTAFACMSPFPLWIRAFEDIDGDAIPDAIVAGMTWYGHDGDIAAISGRTGDPIWTYSTCSELGSGWGNLATRYPDFDEDGVDELVVLGTRYGAVLDIHSGASGARLMRVASSKARVHVNWLDETSGVALLRDLNDDYYPELLTRLPENKIAHEPNCRLISFFPGLTASTTEVSRSGSGVHELRVRFPAMAQGRAYVVLASATGTAGGMSRGIYIPLDRDLLFERSKDPAQPFSPGQWGTLDAEGSATVTLQLPNLLRGFAGNTLYLSAVVYDPITLRPHLASRALTIDIVP